MSATRELTIRMELSQAEAALFEGRGATVTPLADEEAAVLHGSMRGVRRFLLGLRVVLVNIEGEALKEPSDQVTTMEIPSPLRRGTEAAQRDQDAIMQLMGRSTFRGGEDGERTLQ